MGQPVVHLEIVGKDAERLRAYYAELFDWEIDANNPLNYGLTDPEDHVIGLVRAAS
jgi:predicted enzyme related to lactoylglutathione lyase